MNPKQELPINCEHATIEELQNAIKNRLPIEGISTIITHPGAHPDEIFTMYQVSETPEGKKIFPGIKDYGLDTLEKMETYLGTKDFYLCLQRGYLIIGMGGGPFDEHGDRKNKKSCANLMADHLGLMLKKEGRITYGRFLEYINYEDTNGNGQGLLRNIGETLKNFGEISLAEKLEKHSRMTASTGFADNIKRGWKLVEAGIKDADEVITEAFGFIRNEIGNQLLFIKAIAEYRSCKKEIIDLQKKDEGKKKPVIVLIHSDNNEIIGAAKSAFSTNQEMQMRVIVKVNSKGQVYIAPLNGASLYGVVKILRAQLAHKKGIEMPSPEDLVCSGTLPGLEEIFYHAESDSILNGSLTQTDKKGLIAPELFSTDEIIQAIKQGLNPEPAPEPEITISE